MLNPETNAVLVFAKVPEAQTAKSRLAATIGRAEANRIYAQLLQHTARIVDGKPYHVTFPDEKEPGSLKHVLTGARSFFGQHGTTLRDRVGNAFAHLYSQGISTVCAIGCDCPTMTSSDIDRAFALLNGECDVVLGPAEDGGYYLVATRSGCIDIFAVDGWSTSRLLRQTLAVCESKGYRCELLDERYDVDTIEDFQRWQGGDKP